MCLTLSGTKRLETFNIVLKYNHYDYYDLYDAVLWFTLNEGQLVLLPIVNPAIK